MNTGVWVVLRCSASQTQLLETFLCERGLTAWTPQVWVRKRLPRKKTRVPTLIAALPTYVFLKDQGDLTGHRFNFPGGFTVMVIRGEVVLISDPDLDDLRESDRRLRPQTKKWKDPVPVGPQEIPELSPDLREGDRVLIEGGPFQALGLWGRVEAIQLRSALVHVDGSDTRLWVLVDNLKRLTDP